VARGEHGWTAERVGEVLVEAFRRLPSTPIHSPRKNDLRPLLGANPAPADILMITAHVLGRESAVRVQLLTWARCLATGDSFREICAQKGWKRSSMARGRKKALRAIAARLNVDAQAAAAAAALSPAPGPGQPARQKSAATTARL